MDYKSIVYKDKSPYPSIEVCGKNERYAIAIVSNIGSCNSEMSAISMYVYDSIISKTNNNDLSECFHKIAIVEMHHLDIFGQLAMLLGADPRLWNYTKRGPVYWSPGCLSYSRELREVLEIAIKGEQEAISTYREQCSWIKDCKVVANIERILLDEEIHLNILERLYSELC